MADTGEQTRATIKVASKGEDWGEIVLRFFPDVAPNHVKNFLDLAGRKFYDGTTFHRVIPGFMIQGGDPNSKNQDRGMQADEARPQVCQVVDAQKLIFKCLEWMRV